MLSALILLPFLGAVALLFIDRTNTVFIRNFSLFWSLLVFNCSILLLVAYDPTSSNFQLIESIHWLPFTNTDALFAVDGLSILLIILTTFLIPICVLLCWKMPNQTLLKDYNIAFLVLESILIGIFCSLDLLVFYLLFEAVLIPMFFIVGIFGSRERKVRASYLLFLYTLVSSILLFIAILYIYFKTGTTNYLLLKTFEFDPIVERLCWLAFFSSFAVKMPLVPFHIWLPEAHCEAPTAGSVILAGILLKLGGYGFLRFSIGLFPESCSFFTPFVYVLSSFGVVYASLCWCSPLEINNTFKESLRWNTF